ncbi:C40 family peptidase [Streptacidiphilus sp. 4-A2]|nr:C40 family peptidase [Streptacidiphilus sp. 4-A2]
MGRHRPLRRRLRLLRADLPGLAERGGGHPRTSEEQWADLTHVALDDLRPGDLIIYFSDASHVAMYIGGGMVEEAPHPGAFVDVEPMAVNPILGAVRPDPSDPSLGSYTPPTIPPTATLPQPIAPTPPPPVKTPPTRKPKPKPSTKPTPKPTPSGSPSGSPSGKPSGGPSGSSSPSPRGRSRRRPPTASRSRPPPRRRSRPAPTAPATDLRRPDLH